MIIARRKNGVTMLMALCFLWYGSCNHCCAMTKKLDHYVQAYVSHWQQAVERLFATKKSGLLQAHDKAGAPIILEWTVTNIHEGAYARIMHEVADTIIRAFGPVETQYFKLHPDLVTKAEPDNPLKKLEPLFAQGIELVDWAAAEQQVTSLVESSWQEQISETQFTNSIFIFVVAKDALTQDILGFVRYQINDEDPQGTVNLEPLAVDPLAQRRGLGKLLTASIFKLISNATRIFLGSRYENAIKAYQAWGFTVYKHLPSYTTLLEYKTTASDILQKTAQQIHEANTDT